MNGGESGGAPRREARSRPRTCPACGSARVASILYGEPSPSKKMFRDITEGRLLLGGCCITGDDPEWRCADCREPIYRSHSNESQ